MYNDLMWWLLIMTPAVISITALIWRMENRGSRISCLQGHDRNMMYREAAPVPVVVSDPLSLRQGRRFR